MILKETIGTSYGSNMADDKCTPRVNEQLKLKIGAAKRIPRRNNDPGTNGLRDVYCTVALDQEEISRTPIVERTLDPFFDEEYQYEIPRPFRYLAVYVWDHDKHLKHDRPLGKLAIRREELQQYNNDNWFSLRPVDADSEVQGQVHIQISINDGSNTIRRHTNFHEPINEYRDTPHLGTNRTTISLGSGFSATTLARSDFHSKRDHPFNKYDSRSFVTIQVVECFNLAKKNGHCDPYIELSAMYTNDRVITRRTKVCKKTVTPSYNEKFDFDLTLLDNERKTMGNTYTIHPLYSADLESINVSVWHDASMRIFLGEVKLQLRGKQQQNAVQPDAWYYLQPRVSPTRPEKTTDTPPGTRLSSNNELGSLRLKIVHTVEIVFPLATYDPLIHLLLQSLEQPIKKSVVYILGDKISQKTELAQPLVRIFTHHNKISAIIKALADHEISTVTDSTTIFRGNTLVSKMIDEAMRLFGLSYLHRTLKSIVDAIIIEKKPCEIDPSRVECNGSGTDVKLIVKANLMNLQDYVEQVLTAITQSAVRCPAILCQIFYDLTECAAKHFPDNKEVRYSVVSAFIFLRFFAAAILGPKLFDLTSEPQDAQTNRTLTLISKTIQSLGNMVSSRSRSTQPAYKEEYTSELYKRFCSGKFVESVKHFLEVISSVGAKSSDSTILEPVLLKDGIITKRSHKRKRFGRNKCKRYFCLTTQSLSYAKTKNKRSICDIPIADIYAVERLNEQCFKTQNMFQIICKNRTFYVQTSNSVEEKEWVDLLSKVCAGNEARLEQFHPCAYIGGTYKCCGASDNNASGCELVSSHGSSLIELTADLDPARDLQRINTLIIKNRNSLIATDADEYKILQAIDEAALKLDQINQNYTAELLRNIKNGSWQSPIGDDNYLFVRQAGLGNVMASLSLYHHHNQYDRNILSE